MNNQLLASFFIEAPNNLFEDVSVAVELQIQSGTSWWTDWDEGFRTEIVNAHYNDPGSGNQLRRRYRIDVFRTVEQAWDSGTQQSVWHYRIFKAGVYRRRLRIRFNNVEVLTRMINISVQQELEVFLGDGRPQTADGSRVDFVSQVETVVQSNPLNISKPLSLVTTPEVLAARTIQLLESGNYQDAIYVRSNFAIDSTSESFSLEQQWGSTWLRLGEHIRITRYIGTQSYQWGDDRAIIRPGDPGGHQGRQFVPFINDSYEEDAGAQLLENYLVRPVALGLNKPALASPLFLETFLSVFGRGVPRYTGTGEETLLTPVIEVPFSVQLKTVHAVRITPTPLVLDEDNNYTGFVAVDANDGATWTLAPVDPRLNVSPTTGTGRGSAVVCCLPSAVCEAEDWFFANIPLTATSSVNPSEFPDIEGSYTATDTGQVHIERFAPTINALIPRQTGASTQIPAAWESFDHSLSSQGTVGNWTAGLVLNNAVFDNLESFPTVEVVLDTPSRIRSWSLQSVGQVSGARRATVMALLGRTLDGNWTVLDFANRLPNEWVYSDDDESVQYALYTNNKCRVDRRVQHRRVVDRIRIVVLAVEGGSGAAVALPQIQLFAGEPVIPRMAGLRAEWDSALGRHRFEVVASSGNEGFRVFDRAVSGRAAPVGPAAWYLNDGDTTRNNVANRGVVNRLGNFSSVCWLTVSFPKSRLIGYLYSVDKVTDSNATDARLPFAASLYFEGRETADANAVTQTSVEGGWDELGLISLDKCIGFNRESASTTAGLLAGAQTDLNTWANSVLGLSGANRDRAFFVNEVGDPNWSILQFSQSANAWQNRGHLFTEPMDAIADAENQTHYADFATISDLEQLRFVVQSVMNFMRLPGGIQPVQMPEFQLFGLPAETVNTGAVATVSYLKAEDASERVTDILGANQRLPFHSFYSWWGTTTTFRVYLGEVANIRSNDRRLHLECTRTDGTVAVSSVSISSATHMDFSMSGDFRSLSFFEFFVRSASNERIVVSSGYTGAQS